MNRHEELIEMYLDNSLTEDHAEELRTWLHQNADNVKHFSMANAREQQLRAAVRSAEILSAATSSVQCTKSYVQQTNTQRSLEFRMRAWLMWAGATFAVATIIWFTYAIRDAAPQITLSETDALVFLSQQDEGRRRLWTDDAFKKGTIMVESEGIPATFSYPDGTSFSLTAGSELTVAHLNGKRLQLLRGALIADVSPQPNNEPLIVLTPTAEATVLGTSFGISAAEDETLLQVNSGSVRMRRLSDDKAVDVGVNEQVRAGKKNELPLLTEPVTVIPDHWSANFEAEDSVTWIGEPTDGVLKGRFRSTYSRNSGVHSVHVHAGAYNKLQGLATLHADSAVQVRYRIRVRRNIGVFITTHLPPWKFSGNFEGYLIHENIPVDADGWRTATLPLASFYPRSSKAFRPRCNLSAIYLTTWAQEIGLEIAELKVVRTGAGDNPE